MLSHTCEYRLWIGYNEDELYLHEFIIRIFDFYSFQIAKIYFPVDYALAIFEYFKSE